MEFFIELINNHLLQSAFLAWAIAQLLKIFTSWAITKKFDIRLVFSAGGMPSSHTALLTALTYSIGETGGAGTPVFAVAICILLVVMYDAAGVRREAGKHASLLNILVEDWEKKHGEITDQTLKEIIGHTPIEVLGGFILGIIVAALF